MNVGGGPTARKTVETYQGAGIEGKLGLPTVWKAIETYQDAGSRVGSPAEENGSLWAPPSPLRCVGEMWNGPWRVCI
jgi:hypothetical protein